MENYFVIPFTSLLFLFVLLLMQAILPAVVHLLRYFIWALYIIMACVLLFLGGMFYLDDDTAGILITITSALPWIAFAYYSAVTLPPKAASNIVSATSSKVVGSAHEGFNIVLWLMYEMQVASHSSKNTYTATGIVTFEDLKTLPLMTKDKGVNIRYTYSGGMKIIGGDAGLASLMNYNGGADAAFQRSYSLLQTVLKNITGKLKALQIEEQTKTVKFVNRVKELHGELMTAAGIPIELVDFNVEDTELPQEVYNEQMAQYMAKFKEEGKDVLAEKFKERATKMGIDIKTKDGIEALKILSGDIKVDKNINEHRLDVSGPVGILLIDLLKEYNKKK